jgi:hypothetical protein
VAVDLNSVFAQMINNFIKDIHTCLPGQIEVYDGIVATVKPLISKLYLDNIIEPLPIIDSVPVVFPSSATFQMTFPLAKGDGCLILFSERGLDTWIASGVDVPPINRRKFDLSDAICIPGLWSMPTDPKEKDILNFNLKFGAAKLKFNPAGQIALGNPVGEVLDLISQALGLIADRLDAETRPLTNAVAINAIKAKFDLMKGSL